MAGGNRKTLNLRQIFSDINIGTPDAAGASPVSVFTVDFGSDHESPIDGLIEDHRLWLQKSAVHSRPRSVSYVTDDTDFPIDDDSEDDFKFSFFGESRFARRHRKLSRNIQTNTNDLLDSPMSKKQPEISFSPFDTMELDHQQIQSMRTQRIRDSGKLKLNIRFGLLLNFIECGFVAIPTFKRMSLHFGSMATILAFNIISGTVLLWRYSGKYTLPEETGM